MRPRINKGFKNVKWQDLKNYFYDNAVYGFTAKKGEHTILYRYIIMYRNNKKDPEEIIIEVSRASKNVLGGYIENGVKFKTINELKAYTKR